MYYYLENKSQIAGVMAHELSHKLLEHALKRQKEQIPAKLSKSSKETLKNVKKQRYNRKAAAFELLKHKLYANSEKRRHDEYEADSLGYMLLKNTSFHPHDYINALQLYNKYDTIKPKGLDVEIYRQLFDLKEQAFKDEWLKGEDYSQYNYNLYEERLSEDSLSTHPENTDRIERLYTLFPELKQEKQLTKQSGELKKLEETAAYEIVPNLFQMEEYGISLYNSMLFIQNNKDPTFYKKWLGQNFQKIYEARKAYKLNKYLAQIVPNEQSESYRQFLTFMWNLKLDELKIIADYYTVNDKVSRVE